MTSDPKPNYPGLIAMVVGLLLLLSGGLGGGIAPIDPPPFKADKLCVLIVEETSARGNYTAGQLEASHPTGSVRAYVKSKGGESFVLDKDTPLDKTATWVQEAHKAAQPNMLPWIVAATPKAGFSKQLPATAEETLAAVKKLGGD